LPVRDVRETNICAIHVAIDPRTGKVLAFGAIDNLWKGTSAQAVQSLNLMFDRDETEGLL
jgi:N-acetyl-gamma-glutamyl-phosphate reductase